MELELATPLREIKEEEKGEERAGGGCLRLKSARRT